MSEELNDALLGTEHNQNDNTAILLKRISMFLEDGEWLKADEYCERILDKSPENPDAYLGKLLAETRSHHVGELQNLAKPFDDSVNYNRIIRFGSEALKEQLKECIELIKARIETDRLDKAYMNAINLMACADNEYKYKNAAESFLSLSNYKDADIQAQKCIALAEAAKAEEEKKKKRNTKIILIAISVIVFLTIVIVLFTVIIPEATKYDKNDFSQDFSVNYNMTEIDVIAYEKATQNCSDYEREQLNSISRTQLTFSDGNQYFLDSNSGKLLYTRKSISADRAKELTDLYEQRYGKAKEDILYNGEHIFRFWYGTLNGIKSNLCIAYSEGEGWEVEIARDND